MSEARVWMYFQDWENGKPVYRRGAFVVPIGDYEMSLFFYTLRFNLMQKEQSFFREPERTIVCDILANGSMLNREDSRYAKNSESLEIEGLQKELCESRKDVQSWREQCQKSYLKGFNDAPRGIHANYWLKEGVKIGIQKERERVKETINAASDTLWFDNCITLYEELGYDEEE